MSAGNNEITIALKPAPEWGKTSYEATLACPHGRNNWTVFGDEETRLARARSMAPGHRSLCRCDCQLREPAAAAS
jgi:hypothetical protein